MFYDCVKMYIFLSLHISNIYVCLNLTVIEIFNPLIFASLIFLGALLFLPNSVFHGEM